MNYEKDYDIPEINDKEKNFQLVHSILKTQKDLKKAHKNFEFAEDELIDFYTYQIKALQSKLNYLTRIAKIKNLHFNSKFDKVV